MGDESSKNELLVVVLFIACPRTVFNYIVDFKINDTLYNGRGDLAPTRGELCKYVNVSLIINFTIIKSQATLHHSRNRRVIVI